jgi:hypothetical protein
MKSTIPVVSISILFIGVVATVPQADARIARAHISATHVRPNYRLHGSWVNGVWVVGGVAASVAAGTASNCSYYYQKWENTGRKYWRDRYYELCRNWGSWD